MAAALDAAAASRDAARATTKAATTAAVSAAAPAATPTAAAVAIAGNCAVVAAATAVHVGTATPPTAELPAGLAVAARPAPKGVAELYELHCAQCHGEKGDGDGVTELERPARSFVEGGYIYGNTIAAVTRTLRRGIPGSAMPVSYTHLTLPTILLV